MKSVLSAILVAAVCATTAFAETSTDVLVWHIDTTDTEFFGENGPEFNSIKFWAVDPDDSDNKISLGGATYTYDSQTYTSAGSGDTVNVPSGAAPTQAFGDFYTKLDVPGVEVGYSFMMELVLGNDRVAWMTQALTWDQLEQHMIAESDMFDDFVLAQDSLSYNFAATMVPEPTSGLLILFGGALLALRRRRIA